MKGPEEFVVRAVRTKQGMHDVYAFFAPGARLLELAEISRIARSGAGHLSGFQRPQIRNQIRAIADYLSRGSVLFPNAVVLALAPSVRFTGARGSRPSKVDMSSEAGTLVIPTINGRAAAWIVDGQQRSLALSQAEVRDLPIPVIAFVSGDLAVQREQFILVNMSRPLPQRLIDELLPDVNVPLPRDLSVRKIPSALCAVLNESPTSPFHRLVKRPSAHDPLAVITDSALIRVMQKSIRDPRGALAAYVSADGNADMDGMLSILVTFWSTVRDVFPDAWGLPADRSRLMHSAGIESMGVLMDQIMTHTDPDDVSRVRRTLTRMAPHCHWTSGRWDQFGRNWNDVQNTPQDVRILSNFLIALEREASVK